MTKNQSIDKNSIKMAKMLLEKAYSQDEITSALKIRPSTFFKNLHLLEMAGFKIQKESGKYGIIVFKNIFDFPATYTSIMAFLAVLAFNMLPKHKTNSLIAIFENFLQLSFVRNYDRFLTKYDFYKKVTLGDEYEQKIELFQKYLNNKTPLKIMINKSEELEVLPVKFVWSGNVTKFIFENTFEKENIEVLPKNVVKMVPVKKAVLKNKINEKNRTIFELSGRLANTYLLKDEEELIDKSAGRMIIANSTCDKQKLFKRLLRYDILCDIRYTTKDRVAFSNFLKKSLDNIDKFQDNIDK